ncbi:hypothetical protein C9374_003967 [Naegleria lovaniensis]|uniref:Uncharacterized protein n=1 Tax=Naegleria lovaniensis TaxID=51637 RepID=A0AA88H038_NAELO|nr:uncharacterized protein C9374_003967 [Naegleria lovaniensis]KAG2394203.1 hypothetical protein C9374_003967 [Naegleria lovaniensis]
MSPQQGQQSIVFLSQSPSSMDIDEQFSKWHVTQLPPLSRLDILHVVSSSKNSFIWASDDKVFTIGKSKDTIFDDNIHEELILNCREWNWREAAKRFLTFHPEMKDLVGDYRMLAIKNIYASCYAVFVDLGDSVFLASNEHDSTMWKFEKNVKLFVTSSSSNHVLVVFEDNELMNIDSLFFQMPSAQSSEIDGPIVLAATSGKSDIIFTESNKMFVRGDNKFNVQNGVKCITSFCYVETPFETLSKVKDVKCGMFHTAVLLENHEIYLCGDNRSGQVTGLVNNNIGNSNVTSNSLLFTKLNLKDHCQNQSILPESLYCSANSTGFLSKYSSSLYVFGEVVKHLNKSMPLDYNSSALEFILEYTGPSQSNTNTHTNTFTTPSVRNNINNKQNDCQWTDLVRVEPFEMFHPSTGEYHITGRKIPLEPFEFNSVSFGYGHFMCYRKREFKASLQYFKKRLQTLALIHSQHRDDHNNSTSCMFQDVEIISNDCQQL